MKKFCNCLKLFSVLFIFISCDLFSEADKVVVEIKKTVEESVDEVVVGNSEEENENLVNEENKESINDEHKEVKIEENEPLEIEKISEVNVAKVKNRVWTILVYMSGDNQLESAAIEDLCEMQTSVIDDSEVTILALVDRSNGYNFSNGDWTGTRLYRVRTGKIHSGTEILSDEIDCKPLGLVAGVETELEMASNYTLSGVLSYVMEKFPAEKLGLIMWGHGTGWRSCVSENQDIGKNESKYKGFAYDESSGSFMTLKQLGLALKTSLGNGKLDFIGFDTCFSGEIEVAYELRKSARYFVGSEGLVSSSGWNYKKVFDSFYLGGDLSEEKLCKSIVVQFSEQYKDLPRASICAVNLESIENFVTAFNAFCAAAGKSVKSMKIHDELMGVIYSNRECKTEKYTYGATDYDIYLDMASLVENITAYFATTTLKKLCKSFKSAQDECYVSSWASDRLSGGLGVYFSTFGEGGVLVSSHPAAYISGKIVNQIDFVMDCDGYVPGKVTATSLLDSMFYRDFS